MTDKTTSKASKTDGETSSVTVESDDLTHEITESSGEEVTEATEAGAAVPVDTDDDLAEADDAVGDVAFVEPAAKSGINWSRALAFVVLPVLALLLVAAAGYLGWREYQTRATDSARTESLQVAKDSTIRLLSYKPDTVEQDLSSARELLTGDFRDSYTQLTNDVVIPGAKQKQIAALANVPAVASVSADPGHAVALVFVNQTVTVGDSAPTSTASAVKVTLDKVGDRWLISKFDPV